MATNIPPHNMGEVIDGMCCLIDHPDASLDELMQYIKGAVNLDSLVRELDQRVRLMQLEDQ